MTDHPDPTALRFEGLRLVEAWNALPSYGSPEPVRDAAIDIANWCEANLPALLTTLAAPPDTRQSVAVTEEMVERGARAMRDEALLYRVSQIQGFVNHPRDDRHWIRDLTLPPGDQVIWDGGPSSDEMMEALEHIKAKHFARAVLAAAGEGV